METLDITSDSLKNKGYTVGKEYDHMIVKYKDSIAPWITRFDSNNWDTSWNRLANKLRDKGVDGLIISEIESCMAENYDKLMNGKAAADTTTTTATAATTIELTDDLKKEISWGEVSKIESTSIKKDENPKLITFNGMLLAQTNKNQLNVGFQAESAAGKSYIPLDVATYFPAGEVIKIASASPTAFYHSGKWDYVREALIVDLRHKILIFLDMPHFQLLERLRPLLSHDDHELNYKITVLRCITD